MGAGSNSSLRSHDYFHRLSKALEFAVSEWLLMFLLLVDACFAYLIAKFASYCQLQGPCVLCSRFDYVLAKDKRGTYWDSICSHHKSEISSVVLCHAHDKLIDVHGVCENCLLSTTKNKSNAETFQSLVAKRKSNPSLEGWDHDSSGSRICFCCNAQYVSRDYHKNLFLTSAIDSDASESLFESGEHDKNEKNIFIDKSLESFRSSHMGNNHIVPSSEVKYQKANVSSNSESELPVSNNGNAHALVLEAHLRSSSQVEVLDLHHDPTATATIAARPSNELKWLNDANKADTSQMTEQISFDEAQSSEPADAVGGTSDPPRAGEAKKNPVTESEPATASNSHEMAKHLDLGDAYKLAISSKGRQLPGKLLDQKSFQDSSTRVSEDLKLLLSHRSNDNLISPKLSFNSDELTGMQFLQRRISLERNESSVSLDGSIVSEIDGESMVDRLKRQVEHDKKLIGALYKELEEERNASAVATNQAMAMITRLQEEKAALYTEALQCLRMMEEQVEYNSEALQKANDLIEERDKQIQDLEELLTKTTEDVREQNHDQFS